MSEIKAIKDEIQQTFVELKDALKEEYKAAAKGHVDSIIKDHVEKANNAISALEDRLLKQEEAEAKSRALRAVDGQTKAVDPVREMFKKYYKNPGLLTHEENILLDGRKSMNSSSDTAGGYMVIPDVSNQITKMLNETSAVRQYATVETISSDTFKKPQQLDLPTAVWADRDGAPTETAGITWGQLTIATNKIAAEPQISQDLLDDAYLDIESYLTAALVEAFGITEETAFVSGTGVNSPRGFLTYDAGTSWGQIEQVPSLSASALTVDGLTNLVYSLKDGYLANAVFMMRRSTVAAIRKLVDGNGNALWTPAFGAEPAQIMGYPVVRSADMPAVTTNTLPIAFGDFRRAYTIVDRLGMRILRDVYTGKPFVKFYCTKRVGGRVDNYEAIKILKCSAS